jgi:phenylalanyl-tRNA synthetase alpha chain
MLKNQINNLKNEAIGEILEAKDEKTLEEIRARFLGRAGKINELTKEIPKLPKEERGDLGKLIKETKETIEEALRQAKEKQVQVEGREGWFDITAPGLPIKIGHFHPTTQVINQMFEIFKHLGFSVTEGPEIETDKFNFELLNLPKEHPARALQDTLYLESPEILLRTHTSSVEAHVLADLKPPFRVVIAGKCYRYEAVNASNNVMFYQFQGVALQKGLSMADLKGTLTYFVKSFLGENRKIRFRNKYYPEVEPGAGLDVDCPFCRQKGCPVCKNRGWIELLGSGMIHPNLLRNFGYDPKEISGFAFGMGLDRIVMDRFHINDIRSLYNGDINYQE